MIICDIYLILNAICPSQKKKKKEKKRKKKEEIGWFNERGSYPIFCALVNFISLYSSYHHQIYI